MCVWRSNQFTTDAFDLSLICFLGQHLKRLRRLRARSSNSNCSGSNYRNSSGKSWNGAKMSVKFSCRAMGWARVSITIRRCSCRLRSNCRYHGAVPVIHICTHHHQRHRRRRTAATSPAATFPIYPLNRTSPINQIQCHSNRTMQMRRSKCHYTSESIFRRKC